MDRFLVTVETIKIKEYIFSTNKLKLIRGASYLLDYMNQIRLAEIIKENMNGDEDKIKTLYIGAGNGKFVVKGKDTADKIRKEVLTAYSVEAPGSKIVVEMVKISDNGDGSVAKAMDECAKLVAVAKSSGMKMVNIDLPFIKKCELCNSNPAELKINDLKNYQFNERINKEWIENAKGQLIGNMLEDRENSAFCLECFMKLVYSNEIKKDSKKVGFYSIFRNDFTSKFSEYRSAETIEEYSGSKSFIGLMYSDGDGLGDFLAGVSSQVKEDNKYIEFMGKFSAKLDSATKASLLEVIQEMDNEKLFKADKDEKKVYGEFLIVGGDDVCAIFPPYLVAEVSYRFQKKFQEKMMDFKKELEKEYEIKDLENITSSGGVIIAKSKTPVHYLFDKGIELQKLAKKKRWERFGNGKVEKTGFIDFAVIGSEGCADIGKFRGKLKNTYENPYSLEEYRKFADFVKEIRDSKFPKTKLRYIYDVIQDDNMEDFEKKMMLLDILSKMKDSDIRFLVEKWEFKFQEKELLGNFKNIFSVLEMYDYVGGDYEN